MAASAHGLPLVWLVQHFAFAELRLVVGLITELLVVVAGDEELSS